MMNSDRILTLLGQLDAEIKKECTKPSDVDSEVQALFSRAVSLNADDFAVFAHFMGHINAIDIRVMFGGYVRDEERQTNPVLNFSVSLDAHSFEHLLQPLPLLKLANELLDLAHKTYRESNAALLVDDLPSKFEELV